MRGQGRPVTSAAARFFVLVDEQDVGWLEISVNDAVAVRRVDGTRECQDHLGRWPDRLGLPLQVLREAAAGHVFHGEEGTAGGLADIVDLNDIGMPQACQRLDLGAKAGQVGGAGLEAGQDHLEGDFAAKTEMPGLVDDAHSPSTEQPQYLVTRNLGQFIAEISAWTAPFGKCRQRDLIRQFGAVLRKALEIFIEHEARLAPPP